MISKDYKELKKRIGTATSLTSHQAGKVARIVLNMFGPSKIIDFFAEDTDSKEIIRNEKVERKPQDCSLHPSCSGTFCNGCPEFIPVVKPFPKLPGSKKASKKIDVEPPFELEVPNLTTAEVLTGSVIFTPKEFELIRHSLQGAIKSAINEKVNILRKHGDNLEYLQEAMEDILIISKLASRLDKL